MCENGVMFQYFHWHMPADGMLWSDLAERAPELAARGVTAVWIPPCYKGAGGAGDVGYGVYDLFDLGEFDQKGSVRTKYGTKAELLRALAALKTRGIRVYADLVFNQRTGGDETEEVDARVVDMNDRNNVSGELRKIEAHTRFTFPGRGAQHSSMQWRAEHFIATDHDARAPGERCIYLFDGKTFSGDVSFEQGNFDFLMGCDVDTYHPEVFEELCQFGRWFVKETGVDGFRLDALKHIPAGFYKEWLKLMQDWMGERELFAVGEYWSADLAELGAYLERVEGRMRLFDVPLHFRFHQAGLQGRDFDLRTIFDGTLVKANPLTAVTFVDNHDTQPGTSLESWVAPWFKPLAYALILLRREGYPCVFHADYFGHEGEQACASHRALLEGFLAARAAHNFGDQHDYFDHPSCIGWLRTGDTGHPGAMVVLMSSGDTGNKRIETTKPNAVFRDATGHVSEPVHTDESGAGDFSCPGGSLSVWLEE